MSIIKQVNRKVNDLQLKVEEVNIELPEEKKYVCDFITIDNELFIVGGNKEGKALSFAFNQTIYINEETGDKMNEVLLDIWKKYKNGEMDLPSIRITVLRYIKQCFREDKASYGRYEYEVYKKITKSFS